MGLDRPRGRRPLGAGRRFAPRTAIEAGPAALGENGPGGNQRQGGDQGEQRDNSLTCRTV